MITVYNVSKHLKLNFAVGECHHPLICMSKLSQYHSIVTILHYHIVNMLVTIITLHFFVICISTKCRSNTSFYVLFLFNFTNKKCGSTLFFYEYKITYLISSPPDVYVPCLVHNNQIRCHSYLVGVSLHL